MFLTKKLVRLNKVLFAVLLFVTAFTVIHMNKPLLMYSEEGGFRPFGVGYKHKTVIPIWVASIVLAIFSYLAVLVYVNN